MSLGIVAGCNRKPAANTDANQTDAGKESPFAYMTDPAEALAEGNRLLDDNQTEMAIEAFRQAVKLDPDLAEAHFKLGIAYALIEAEMQDVGFDPNQSSNTDPKKPSKPVSQREFERAVDAYKKWLKANPKDDVAQFNLGRAYNKLNRDDAAEDAFRDAVKLKPDDTEYQTELGAILIKLAKYHEALSPLKKALELDAENSRAENLLEDAQAGAKRVDFAQSNSNVKKANSNSNANANVNSNSTPSTNTPPAKQANSTPKPKNPEIKVKKP